MIRIKFVKDYKQYKRGDTENFSPNEAFGLIDSGKAVVSKDMTESDYTISTVVRTGLLTPVTFPSRTTVGKNKPKNIDFKEK